MYVNLSPEAKILYSILLKRMELSARNGWLDSQGRVFIIFTLEEIMEKLHCADNKATKLMKELEKCDLIARRRQGMGRPNLIYVKNFIQNVDNSGSSPPDSSESRIKTRENHDSGLAETTNHDSLESRVSYRDISDTDKSDRDNLINLEAMDGLSNHALYEKYFRNALDYPILLQSYPLEKETLEGILNILVDTCCSTQDTIRIGGDNKPIEVVKSRFMKLTYSHIEYVLECLKENTTGIHNIMQYMLSALFNAPTTISPYFQAKVNYDLYGEGARASPKRSLRNYSFNPDDDI